MQLEATAIAREAAEALRAEFGSELPVQTERLLHESTDGTLKVDVGDVVSIATLVVSLAQLAVMLYQGATDSGAKTQHEIQEKLVCRVVAQTRIPPETARPVAIEVVTAMFRKRSDS